MFYLQKAVKTLKQSPGVTEEGIDEIVKSHKVSTRKDHEKVLYIYLTTFALQKV